MKRFFAAVVVLFFLSCNNAGEKNKAEEMETETIEPEVEKSPDFASHFPELNQYLGAADSSFQPERFGTGEIVSRDTSAPQTLESGTLEDYRKLLVYNSDSSQAIDLVTYNFILNRRNKTEKFEFAGPDTEIALLDLKKNTRKRILFLGSAGLVMDGKWEADGNIILAGAEEAGDGKLHPVMWRYYPATGEVEVFTYPGTIEVNISEYYDRKYNSNSKTIRAA